VALNVRLAYQALLIFIFIFIQVSFVSKSSWKALWSRV
jgi:hypothetical protein